ncbi:hypothetical protein U9M48_018818, partial [Paspalum notatum var. saurae]
MAPWKILALSCPSLYSHVTKRAIKGRTVWDALENNAWVRDLRGGGIGSCRSVGVGLHRGVEDQHIWAPSSTGVFSTKSAYRCLFVGAIEFEPRKDIWKTWAPPRCKLVFIWLAVLNRCWTADRLARRGLQHPKRYPLCDQEEETVQHLLISCVFARIVWFAILERTGLHQAAPAWCIWKHKNGCVFEGASPSFDSFMSIVAEKANLS